MPVVKPAYKHLETDEEFRRRAPGTYLAFDRKVKQQGWYGVEYEENVRECLRVADLRGDDLDEAMWLALKMQRKIVEVFP